MWLMASPLSLTTWWRPGGVRCPLYWSCRSKMRIHHACTLHNAWGSTCTWTGLLTQIPAIWPIHSSEGSSVWPKFNACISRLLMPVSLRWVGRHLGYMGSLEVGPGMCVRKVTPSLGYNAQFILAIQPIELLYLIISNINKVILSFIIMV